MANEPGSTPPGGSGSYWGAPPQRPTDRPAPDREPVADTRETRPAGGHADTRETRPARPLDTRETRQPGGSGEPYVPMWRRQQEAAAAGGAGSTEPASTGARSTSTAVAEREVRQPKVWDLLGGAAMIGFAILATAAIVWFAFLNPNDPEVTSELVSVEPVSGGVLLTLEIEREDPLQQVTCSAHVLDSDGDTLRRFEFFIRGSDPEELQDGVLTTTATLLAGDESADAEFVGCVVPGQQRPQ